MALQIKFYLNLNNFNSNFIFIIPPFLLSHRAVSTSNNFLNKTSVIIMANSALNCNKFS